MNNRKRRWSDRARMILTLELAIVLPAAALIGFSVWNLKSIERDRAVEAAIQRDFNKVLSSAEKEISAEARDLVMSARADFPCPDDKTRFAAGLDKVLEHHPEFQHAMLYDQKSDTLVVRTRSDDREIRAEGEQWAEMTGSWIGKEVGSMVERARGYEEKDGAPYLSFYGQNWVKRDGKKMYAPMVYFLPADLPKGRAAMAALAFDPKYLVRDFFPKMLARVLPEDHATTKTRTAMMVHVRKEYEPLVATAGWDGGKYEVSRSFEDVFQGLALAMKFRGTTIAAISERFMHTNFWIVGGLSLLLAFGVWQTYRNVSREMEIAKLKSDFVANVSHELRTPLALIRLYAETLEMGRISTEEKFQEYYRTIRKESERLTALINNILDFSRIEAGRKEYDFRETNLAELVRNTLESYRFQIEQNGFAYRESIQDDLPPVKVDREAIARTLLNLINNALKYSQSEKFLGVRLYRSNGNVQLEVEDHGIGIPRPEQDKIFEKFYRVGDPLVHNTKGSGLGLSLVRHIVQAHGGDISVESAPGKGSKFIIALPVQGAAQPQQVA